MTQAWVFGMGKIWIGEVREDLNIIEYESIKNTHLSIRVAVMIDKLKWPKDQPWPNRTKLVRSSLYHRWPCSRSRVK
jgi:hypothetical protein